jgi:thiosulfate dehydrogenase (quinone) large subunit
MTTVNRLPDDPALTARALPTTRLDDRWDDSGDITAAPSRWLATLRLATGFLFLWNFLDKLFGLGYATESDRAWIEGASPTEGFLQSIAVGPFQDTFHDWAGQTWPDWLFMVGLAGVGVALLSGVALRFAALSGTLMLAVLWASQWPPAQNTSTGEPTGSNNPLVDSHVIYALALIACAVTAAGDRWGLGRYWGQLSLVRRFPFLR